MNQGSNKNEKSQTSQVKDLSGVSSDPQRTQSTNGKDKSQMSQVESPSYSSITMGDMNQQKTVQINQQPKQDIQNIAGNKFLVIFAHPEQKSFCGMIKNNICDNLRSKGFEVEVSDLYLMMFNPVVSPKDFTNLKNPNEFHYLEEQKNAFENNFKFYSADIQKELEKIKNADYLLFMFPLWFGSFPAIMKGWLDKCLVYGHAWKIKDGRFEGLLKQKKAMCIITCEDSEKNYTREGSHGKTIDEILYHFNRSSMGMCGIPTAKSFVFYGMSGMSEDEKKNQMKNLISELENFDKRETLNTN